MAFWVIVLIFWVLPPKNDHITSNFFTATMIINSLHSAQFGTAIFNLMSTGSTFLPQIP